METLRTDILFRLAVGDIGNSISSSKTGCRRIGISSTVLDSPPRVIRHAGLKLHF